MAVFKIKITRRKPPSVLYIRASAAFCGDFILKYNPTLDCYQTPLGGVRLSHDELRRYLNSGWTLLRYEE